jgi:hypothetical protein
MRRTARLARRNAHWARFLRPAFVAVRWSRGSDDPGCDGVNLTMTDLLVSAAKRLGIPTETSAGPGGGSPPSFSIWARWPRHPQEIAQDVLNHVIRSDANASLTPVGGTPLWRARHGHWTHIGRFEDAVAHLATHVASRHERNVAGRPDVAPVAAAKSTPRSSTVSPDSRG